MLKRCKVSGLEFEITDSDQKFYSSMGLGLPDLCPQERCRRRLAWQNMSHLYRRQCSATGKWIISNISQEKPFPVYDQPFWWSDNWDSRTFGRDFDFSKTFAENFSELLHVVPQPNLATSYLLDENSEYTNYAGGNKNCYFIFHADMNRDCMYGVGIKKCVDVVDGLHVHGSELLYESVDCRSCYDLKFCEDCENCSSSWFLKSCTGCKNCFGCINLRQQEFHIYNKPVSAESFSRFVAAFDSTRHSTIEEYRLQVQSFFATQPQRGIQGYQNENISGDQIFRSKDIIESFDIQESRDMRYCHRVYNGPNSDCADVNEYGMGIQRVNEGLAIGINAHTIIACMFVNEQVSDIAHSIHVHHAHDIFGCISIPRGEYCILNKQYTKDEYFRLKQKIVQHMQDTGEWGHFFPIEMSPFGYNETVAQEYFPLSEQQARARGYSWYVGSDTTLKDNDEYCIADSSTEISDEVLSKILRCEITGRAYKIQKAELKFYRSQKLPIPRVCYHQRHLNRWRRRNPRILFNRSCSQCGTDMRSSFSAERPETVLCDACYERIL